MIDRIDMIAWIKTIESPPGESVSIFKDSAIVEPEKNQDETKNSS